MSSSLRASAVVFVCLAVSACGSTGSTGGSTSSEGSSNAGSSSRSGSGTASSSASSTAYGSSSVGSSSGASTSLYSTAATGSSSGSGSNGSSTTVAGSSTSGGSSAASSSSGGGATVDGGYCAPCTSNSDCASGESCAYDGTGHAGCLTELHRRPIRLPPQSTCEPLLFDVDNSGVVACEPAGQSCIARLGGSGSSSGGSSSGGSGLCPTVIPGTVLLCGSCCSDQDCAANEYCVVGKGSNYCSYNCAAAPPSACLSYGCAGGASGVPTVDGGTIGGACTCQG